MRRFHAAAIALSCVVIGTAFAPSPVVERTVTAGTRSTRVSLFDNRMAAVVVREEGEVILQRTVELEPLVYTTYVAAVDADRDTVQGNSGPPTVDRHRFGEIRLTEPGGEVKVVHYAETSVAELALSRLLAALDDLETYVESIEPVDPTVAAWTPRRGDIVLMRNGRRARVSLVRDDGVLSIEYLDVAVVEMIPPDKISEVVAKVEKAER